MKSYLFTYSQVCTQAQVHDILNTTAAVETWVAPFPYSAILVSKLNTQDLCAVFRARLPGVWFMVAEMNNQVVDGWLPGDIWEYVNNPLKAWSQKLIESIVGEKYRRQPTADADKVTGR